MAANSFFMVSTCACGDAKREIARRATILLLLESVEMALGGYLRMVYFTDSGPRRPHMQPGKHAIYRVDLPLQGGLDRAVARVANPPGYAKQMQIGRSHV